MFFLAQLAVIPVESQPIRLPFPKFLNEKNKIDDSRKIKIELPSTLKEVASPAKKTDKLENTSTSIPLVKGNTIYTNDELTIILANCRGSNATQILKNCAATLTSKLISDGYINSRVFTINDTYPAYLEVVEGRIFELKIDSNDNLLKKDIIFQLKPLINSILHIPTLEKELVKLRSIPGAGEIAGSLGRVGSDPTKAILRLSINSYPIPWSGDITIRNDGYLGTGEWRSISNLIKRNFVKHKDIFINSIEINTSNNFTKKYFGSFSNSTSYTYPLSNDLTFTSALAYSQRSMIETSDDISFRQFQLTGQLEKIIENRDNSLITSYIEFNANQNESYLDDKSIPLIIGGGNEGRLRTGYLKGGFNFSGISKSLMFSGTIYGLQGISGISSASQLDDLSEFGIIPGESRAVGTVVNFQRPISKSVSLYLKTMGQQSYASLTSNMGISLGSDSGLRGLPGSISSGDSGWMGLMEVPIEAWTEKEQSLAFIPYYGLGSVNSTLNNNLTKDSLGALGVIGRYKKLPFTIELGWVKALDIETNSTSWDKWMLSNGVYTQFKYQF